MQLSLAAGTILDVPPARMPGIAAAAGFRLLGVRLDPAAMDAEHIRDLKRAIAQAGVQVFDVEVLRLNPDEADANNLRLIDAAAEIGARQVLTVSQEPAPERTVERLHRLCEHAASLGLGVAVEFMRFTTVRTLPDAVQLLESVDHPALGVLVDVLHLARTDGRASDLAAIPAGRAPYAQICDAHTPGQLPTEADCAYEARYDRAMPGQGALPLVEFARACLARPDVAALSVEVQSTALASRLDAEQRARLAYTTTAALVDTARVVG